MTEPQRRDRRPRVLWVASFPPPFTGQTVATESFARWTGEVADVQVLDLADPDRHRRPSGRFSRAQLGRVLDIRREVRNAGLWDVGYLTVASSALGQLRDLALLSAMRPAVSTLVVHVYQGSFGLATEGLTRTPYRRALLRRVDRFIFQARTLADWAPWIPRDRIRIVPNPPGAGARFTPAEVRRNREARADEEAYRVLFLANPLPQKGHERLLEALPRLSASLDGRRPEVHLVGAWPSLSRKAAYERRARALGLGDVLQVHGGISDRSRIRELLARAHVLAFPSTYREEGAPLAVVEALGAGTPVVASGHGALPEMVDHGRSGRVLPDPEPPALADALLELADPTVWEASSRAARTAYEERYAVDIVRASFLAALVSPGDP